MAGANEAWGRVGDRLSALALKLRLHASEEYSAAELESKVGFEKFRAVVDEAMDSIQQSYEDEAVRADVRDARQAFAEAIDATIRDVTRSLGSSGASTSAGEEAAEQGPAGESPPAQAGEDD